MRPQFVHDILGLIHERCITTTWKRVQMVSFDMLCVDHKMMKWSVRLRVCVCVLLFMRVRVSAQATACVLAGSSGRCGTRRRACERMWCTHIRRKEEKEMQKKIMSENGNCSALRLKVATENIERTHFTRFLQPGRCYTVANVLYTVLLCVLRRF